MPVYIHGSDYDNLIYGEDGASPLRGPLERYLANAKEDACRLRIEIRVTPQGSPSSHQEHQWEVDPTDTSPDGILKHICDKLGESPSEGFAGQIRINFSQAGSSGNRYGSFTRVVMPATSGATGFGGGMGPGGGTWSNAPRGGGYEPDDGGGGETEEGEESEDIENGAGQLDRDGLPRFSRGGPSAMMGRGMVPAAGGIWMDEASLKTWLETVWGFNFRQQASMLAMFERATRMMEAIALRFGMPEVTQPRGITDVRANPGAAEGAGGSGLGLLPMLIKAAAHIAGSENPGEAVDRAARMAGGETPPEGAARALAIRGAANMVQSLRARPAPPPPRPMRRAAPEAEAYEDGEGETEEEAEDEEGGGEDGSYDEGGFNDDNPDDEGSGDGGGMPSFEDLPPDQVFDKLEAWIKKDPSRKGQVTANLGRLMKLME